MFLFIRLTLLILIAPALMADANSNAVNERIPVRKAELEDHWDVDCSSSWKRWVALQSDTRQKTCDIPPALQRQLKLCAFIYQPPGEEYNHSGPDYQGAVNSKGVRGCQSSAVPRYCSTCGHPQGTGRERRGTKMPDQEQSDSGDTPIPEWGSWQLGSSISCELNINS